MIYLDSALVEQARQLTDFPWVKGITTNPMLLAQSPLSPIETLQQLAQLSPGELYYQLVSTEYQAMLREGKQAYDLIGEQTVLKIPATAIGLRVVTALSPQIACSVTAIYHPIQAAIAAEAGAQYAIAYVNRATCLLGDGLALVGAMAQILRGSATQILAASLKNPSEAAQALQAGADHLTVPFPLLPALASHPLSEERLQAFNQAGRGII